MTCLCQTEIELIFSTHTSTLPHQINQLSIHIPKMGIIAVAGGTGSVGRTIVDALVARATHKVIILSRTVCTRVIPCPPLHPPD